MIFLQSISYYLISFNFYAYSIDLLFNYYKFYVYYSNFFYNYDIVY